MPRSGPNGTYTLPGAQATQQPGTPIPSAVNNQGYSDIEQTFNTVQPRAYGGTDSSDLKLNDANFGVRNNADATKIGVFNAAGLPTATTRTYDLPYYSGTLGLVSDIRGQIYGLTLSNNVTDPTNDIDIAAGSAVDTTGVVSMQLLVGLTKRADAVWAAGTNQGGRFYTTLSDGTLHWYLIRNPITGVVDVGLSDNATNPTGGASYPAGFTQYRYLFPTIRSTGAILPFSQNGNTCLLGSIVTEASLVTPGGTTATTLTLSAVPTGVVVDALLIARADYVSVPGGMLFSSLAAADQVPGGAFITVGTASTSTLSINNITIRTNTSRQIRFRSNTTGSTYTLGTIGWIYER